MREDGGVGGGGGPLRSLWSLALLAIVVSLAADLVHHTALTWFPLLLTVALVGSGLYFVYVFLTRRW